MRWSLPNPGGCQNEPVQVVFSCGPRRAHRMFRGSGYCRSAGIRGPVTGGARGKRERWPPPVPLRHGDLLWQICCFHWGCILATISRSIGECFGRCLTPLIVRLQQRSALSGEAKRLASACNRVELRQGQHMQVLQAIGVVPACTLCWLPPSYQVEMAVNSTPMARRFERGEVA